MEYRINPEAYSDVFVVPKAVVNENIRLANSIQLKVLLCLLNGTLEAEDIAAKIGIDKLDVLDAMIFWAERGMLIKDGQDAKPMQKAEPVTQIKPETPPVSEAKKHIADLPISRPTHEQISIRCNECEEFKALFQEAQMRLGKTIGYEGQSILIMLHDSYDLPVEVILMLIEYAKSKGKTGYKYIASVGKEWSEKEIDSLEAAEEYIKEQNETSEVWKAFKEASGAKNTNPTAKQRRFLKRWSKELGFSIEMILLACEISIDNTEKTSLEYMDRVLTSWKSKEISTPAQVEKEKQEWEEKRYGQKKKTKTDGSVFSSDASYDIDEFTRNSIGFKKLREEQSKK